MANLIRLRKTHHYGLGGLHGANSGADAGSAHRPKTMSDCRGSPHSLLHQDRYES
ncbi:MULTISPECIES: hypothetical protein [Moorena]|uniref:hypothetical protein n=1 Tax=Moorena TaxID=1155738 RepID=UPI0012B603BC|nr:MULTISPECIES: hypothetical protein [Moorena]NEQ17039.1 hypothetical protein [Moorena sp. SIO3E2]NEP34584.1 hypothetical protein [Moorena sp. SIO3B2]NEQ07083.1 hypothetical protein [Moorena sp. SIO4E2]NER86674.1 hypothetical protein [Moorena sp. SIO3A2]NES43968.1 hypothetical protein [Moorena sp. SIO2C4]